VTMTKKHPRPTLKPTIFKVESSGFFLKARKEVFR